MGKYVNPVVFKLNKLEEENRNLKGETKEENKEVAKEENIISLDAIMDTPTVSNIEMIEAPTNAVIVGLARGMLLSLNDIGAISIKYSEKFSNKNEMSI